MKNGTSLLKAELPVQVIKIINILEDSGYEAYLVGGCVRDLLLQKEPTDWDLCTNAKPQEMKESFAGFPVVETGIKHGTVTIGIDGRNYEVTTFRVDGEYKDNRRPETVSFTKDLRKDLSRRDFTVNAMAYHPKSGLIDCFQGQEDLKAEVIRCVGVPSLRFEEDALRIMRALRFASRLGFSIEEETKQAIFERKELLSEIAVERIRDEFDKLLCGDGADRICQQYREVLAVFIPEIKEMFDFDQCTPYHVYDVWHHTMKAVENIKNTGVLKLAAFFHDIGKPSKFSIGEDGRGHFYKHEAAGAEMASQIMSRLKYDNDTRKTVRDLIEYHGTVFRRSEKQAKKLLNKLGEEKVRMLIELEYADVKSQNPVYTKERVELISDFSKIVDAIIEEEQCFSTKDMEIDGRDLIRLGVPQGPEIGIILKELLHMILEGNIENDKTLLLTQAKEMKGKESESIK